MANIIIAKNSDGSCDIIKIFPGATIEYLGSVEVEQDVEIIAADGKIKKKKKLVKVPAVLERPQTIEEHVMAAIPEFRALIKKETQMSGYVECTKEVETFQDAYKRIGASALQKIRPYRIATADALPKDTTFRAAWVDNDKTQAIDIDMVKAREIHLQNIKAGRAKKFEELGFPIQLDKDLEAGIISKATQKKLQALRDIPQKLDLTKAKTPAELKAIWPDELK